MFISLKRIIKSGWTGFLRNKGASSATIFIIALNVFLFSFLIIFQYATQFVISEALKKVDVSVYFKEEITSEALLELKSEMAKIPEVKSIEYISKETALEEFIKKHKNNPLIIESVDEVGNFCLASLNIRTQNASQYGSIISFLENSRFNELIDHTNYSKSKAVIDKVFSLTTNIKLAGLILGLFLALLAILVAFSTIHLAIMNSREEISIMRLVGASNWFIRGPFIVQAILSGLIAVFLAVLVFGLTSYFLSPKIEIVAPGLDLFGYFVKNFLFIFLGSLGVSLAITALSSAIVVRKYLRI